MCWVRGCSSARTHVAAPSADSPAMTACKSAAWIVQAPGDNERCTATARSPEAEIRGPGMLDPYAVLGQARQDSTPATWQVFTKERGRVRGFLRGTSADPDPVLVITPAGVVEY